MQLVKEEFRTRTFEVNNYLSFLNAYDCGQMNLNCSSDLMSNDDTPNEEHLLKTLKANAFLILYNLIESTMTSVVQSIFDELQEKRVSFDECRDELRKLVLRRFRKKQFDDLVEELNDLAKDIIYHAFGGQYFSGNLDQRKMEKTASDFGYAQFPSKKYWKLLEIKTKRNDLAHGVKSFAEVGRETSVDDLLAARDQVVESLKYTIDAVEDYLNQKHYLRSSVMFN